MAALLEFALSVAENVPAVFKTVGRLSAGKKKDGSESGSAAGSMNTGNYVNMKKALREAQDEMAKIRRSASGAGVNIPQSKWETVTVTY